jgi:hypothetical protein
MRLIIALLLCLLCCKPASWAQNYAGRLPSPARLMLNGRFPGWKFAEVSPEVRQFFEQEMKGASPSVINGDFDGNGRLDYAALIQHGKILNERGKAIGSRYYLVAFLRRGAGYRMYVIKDPGGEYLCLAKKGTRDYNYEEQKEITYANDAIMTGIFEKGGSSYVYKNGKFFSFISSD